MFPRREDFFPKTRRGHGSAHSPSFTADRVTCANPDFRKVACVDGSCSLFRENSKNLHEDKRANIRDWCDEHGVLVLDRQSPAAAMIEATGGC